MLKIPSIQPDRYPCLPFCLFLSRLGQSTFQDAFHGFGRACGSCGARNGSSTGQGAKWRGSCAGAGAGQSPGGDCLHLRERGETHLADIRIMSETSTSESWAEVGAHTCLEGRGGQGAVLVPSANAGRGRCGVQEVDAEKEVDAEDESGMVHLRHTLASSVIRDYFPDLFAKNLDKHIHTSFVAYDLDGSGALDKQVRPEIKSVRLSVPSTDFFSHVRLPRSLSLLCSSSFLLSPLAARLDSQGLYLSRANGA